jgi:hypothetical protein
MTRLHATRLARAPPRFIPIAVRAGRLKGGAMDALEQPYRPEGRLEKPTHAVAANRAPDTGALTATYVA